MLIRFSSIATGSITMFGDIALQCLEMLGVGPTVPGAIIAKDIPSSLQSLRKRLRSMAKETSLDPQSTGGVSPEEEEQAVDIETRVWPLVEPTERACAADAAVGVDLILVQLLPVEIPSLSRRILLVPL